MALCVCVCVWGGGGGGYGVVCDQKTGKGPQIKDYHVSKEKVVISCQITRLGTQILFHVHKFRKIGYITIPLVSLCSKCFSWRFFWEKKPCERSRCYI